jgi:hypothetical protein
MKIKTAVESIKSQTIHTSAGPGRRSWLDRASGALAAAVLLSALTASAQNTITLYGDRDNLATVSGGSVAYDSNAAPSDYRLQAVDPAP